MSTATNVVEEYVPQAIMLTGGAGFIGSNVLLALVKEYPDTPIVCFDKVDYCANTKNFEEIKEHKNFQFVKGDITSADLVRHVLEREKIDTIMHFAAQTHVDNSFGNSFSFTMSNVYGTHVLLESAKACGKQIRRFIHVSTDEVYGESTHDDNDESFHEKSALNPTNPYAATKAAAEFIVKSYYTSFKLPTIITRGNNVYGPRQYPEKLIPKFINLLARDKPLPIHGDGSNKRGFLYVEDVARAFLKVLKNARVGEVYNIGTDHEISNLDVTRALLKAFGKDKEESKYIQFVSNRPFNDARYHIDLSKLEKLGWAPQVSFEDGLKKTIEWYMNNIDHWNDISGALVAHPRAGLAPA